MLKKCISLWIIICLLFAVASRNHKSESIVSSQGQSAVLVINN